MIGLWFLSTVLPVINIYACSQLNFTFTCTFKDMARTGNTYDKWLRGDNSTDMQGMIMVIGFCHSPHCHPSIYQVLFKCQQWF